MRQTRYFGYVGGSEHPADRVVIEAFEAAGLERVFAEGWDILWYLTDDPPREVMDQIKSHQILNHFPNTSLLCNKLKMYRSLASAYEKILPSEAQETRFFAHTWSMPEELEALKCYAREHPDQRFIVKPKIGAWGRGIRVLDHVSQAPLGDGWLVQEYLDQPYLYQGHKFNLRLFALVVNVNPLVFYIYREGYVDLAGEPWKPGASGEMESMHNTNSGIQKGLPRTDGIPLSIAFSEWLKAIHSQGAEADKLWQRIRAVVTKSLICMEPGIMQALHDLPITSDNCFELFGYDVMLDSDMNPWVIEHNRSPSMTMNYIPSIKRELLGDLIRVISSKRVPVQKVTDPQTALVEQYPPVVGQFERVMPLVEKSGEYQRWRKACG